MVLTGYSGGVIKHLGVVTLPLRIAKIETPTAFFVVKEGRQVLLGLEACERFGLVSRGQCLQVQRDLESQVLSEFPRLFNGSGFRLEERSTAVALPAHWIPHTIREPIGTELACMEWHKNTERVHKLKDWISPLVTVLKNGCLHTCMNLRHIN